MFCVEIAKHYVCGDAFLRYCNLYVFELWIQLLVWENCSNLIVRSLFQSFPGCCIPEQVYSSDLILEQWTIFSFVCFRIFCRQGQRPKYMVWLYWSQNLAWQFGANPGFNQGVNPAHLILGYLPARWKSLRIKCGTLEFTRSDKICKNWKEPEKAWPNKGGVTTWFLKIFAPLGKPSLMIKFFFEKNPYNGTTVLHLWNPYSDFYLKFCDKIKIKN